MTEDREEEARIDQFILEYIDTVPHLEALLLLRRSRPKAWEPEELVKRLYVSVEHARTILQDLAREHLVVPCDATARQYRFESKPQERDQLIGALDRIYSHEVVRISTMIHSKPSAAVRDFARAFRIKKERT